MQYLVLALLAIIFLLVLQLLRRLDEVARAVQELSTWTEILVCFEYGSPGGIAWDGSEKMCKNICPGT